MSVTSPSRSLVTTSKLTSQSSSIRWSHEPKVPGFRVGKAPRAIVEKKFRKQVADQVKGSLLMDSLTQISDQETFSAISEPDLDFQKVEIPEEGDLTYEFNIEVRPEFDLPQWKGLKLERPEKEFTDADVDAEIVGLGRRVSDLVPVEEPVAADDFIICNITSTFDDEVVSSQEEVSIEVKDKLSFADATIGKILANWSLAKRPKTRSAH